MTNDHKCLCGDRHRVLTFMTPQASNDNACNTKTVVPYEDDRFIWPELLDDSPASGFFFIP